MNSNEDNEAISLVSDQKTPASTGKNGGSSLLPLATSSQSAGAFTELGR